MLTIRLPDDLEKRLNQLATVTNRPKSFYVREALERSLEDMEDIYLADTAYEKWVAGGKKSKSLEAIGCDIELED